MAPTNYLGPEEKQEPKGPGGGGGAHKHFFDRNARPRTNFNYPKNRMTLNSNPKKIECPKIQTQKNRMTQDAMFVKV